MSELDAPLTYHSNDSLGPSDNRLLKVPGWKNWDEYEEQYGHFNYKRMRPILYKYLGVVYPRKAHTYWGDVYSKEHLNLKNAHYSGFEYKTLLWIPESPHRYVHWDAGLPAYNEHGVTIVHSACAGKKYINNRCRTSHQREIKKNCSYMDAKELTHITLERAKNVEEALEVVTGLIDKYGYTGNNRGYPFGLIQRENGDSFMISDKEDTWVLHVTPADDSNMNAVWVAQRLPEDHFVIVPNVFTIRDVDLTDKTNFRWSKNYTSVAKSWGQFKDGQTKLDFNKVYGGGEYGFRYYAGRRIWRALDLLRPDLKFPTEYDNFIDSNPYPFSIPLTSKIGLEFFKQLSRDSYEGTPYDLTQGVAAGPYQDPVRYIGANGELQVQGYFERSISIYRSHYSFIVVGDKVEPYMLFTYDYQINSYYSLVPISMNNVEVFTGISPYIFDTKVAMWTAKNMNQVSHYRYLDIHPEIEKFQKLVEDYQFNLWTSDDPDRSEKLELSYTWINNVWRNLAKVLEFKYNNQYLYDCEVTIEQLMQEDWDLKCQDAQKLWAVKSLGYPDQWLATPGLGYLHTQ